MRTASKIVLVIIIITLVYSIVKLINASTTQTAEITTITLPLNNQQNDTISKVNQNTNGVQTASMPQNSVTTGTNKMYHADEILIDGQGQAGQNYIDITSTTPITPQTTQQNNTQSNNGGAYAQASVTIENNNTSTSAQTYAPGVPAFEVIDGN